MRGPAASLKLLNPSSHSELALAVTAYDGVFRVRVTEPVQSRFEVPDVLQDDLISKPVQWTSSKVAAKALNLQLGSAALTVQYKPFRVSLTVKGSEVVQLNSRSLFNFEPLRQKQVCLCCSVKAGAVLAADRS